MRIFNTVAALFLAVATVTAQEAPQEAHATVNQLMRGVLYPSSNIIFDASNQDPEASEEASAPGAGPRRPFDGPFGGWEAVENAALALAESANLLLAPERVCANGRPAPVASASWIDGVGGLREAGMAAYEAARSRSQDAMFEASNTMTVACSNCHQVYRDVEGGTGNRCQAN